MTRRVLSIAALTLVGFSASGAAQTPPRDVGAATAAGTGVIAGRVVTKDADKKPVRRAMVSLYTGNSAFGGNSAARVVSSTGIRMIVTDDQGRFEFDGLPAGRYTLELRKASFRSTFYGATSSANQGLAIALADGQRITNIEAPIARGAVVTGRVVDQNNVPIAGARILALQRVMINGAPVLRNTAAGSYATDDRGVYRFYGFEAGTYVVSVSLLGMMPSASARIPTVEELGWAARRDVANAETPPPPGRPVKFANVYYPGVVDPAQATPLTFAAGQEIGAIDIVVPFVQTATITGKVSTQTGQPFRNAIALLQSPLADPGIFTGGARVQVQPEGVFMVEGVEPGKYTLTARASTGTAPAPDLWASVELNVIGADVDDVSVVLQPTLTIPVRVSFDSAAGAAPLDGSRAGIVIRTPQGLPNPVSSVAAAQPGGALALTGVVPGPYMLNASIPGAGSAGWTLAGATLGGRDVADGLFEIRANDPMPELAVRFIDRPTEVTGQLLDRTGQPVSEYSVIVFSTNPAHWIQNGRRLPMPTRAATDGHYSIRGLPPGEYYIAALTGFDPQEWYTTPFLEQVVPTAIKITLAEGEKMVQTLRLR